MSRSANLAVDDGPPVGRRRASAWLLCGIGYAVLGIAFVAVLAAAGFYLRLASGPLSLADFTERLSTELSARIGPGWRVRIGAADLDLVDGTPAVRASAMEVRNPDGLLIVQAPRAIVSLDMSALVTGAVVPREIDLQELRLRALVGESGELFVVAPGDADAAAQPIGPRLEGAGSPAMPLAGLLVASLDPLLKATHLFGGLERVSITDAKLLLMGTDGVERLSFRDVDARYENLGDGERRLELSLEGDRGRWLLGGQLSERKGRRIADLQAEGIPLADLVSLRRGPAQAFQSNVKLALNLRAALDGRAIHALEGSFGTTPGRIEPSGTAPILLDRAEGRLSWNGERGTLDVADLVLESGGTRLRAKGDIRTAEGGGWRLGLDGVDVVLDGLTPRDPAFRVDGLRLQALVREGTMSIESLSAKGEDLDASLTATSRSGPDGRDLEARIEVARSDVRRVLRLWPANVSPRLRAYLVDHLTAGRVEALSLRAGLDARNLDRALADEPLPEAVIDGRFQVADASLSVAPDIPPLQELGAQGRFSGNRVTFAAKSAAMTMPDGRRLAFADGSYDQPDYDLATTVARLSFRVLGPADAFASLMRSPTLLDAGAPDVDPATLRGRGDVRVTLALPLKAMPQKLAALSVGLAGNLSDLTADKLVGKEKLEGGNLALSLDAGVLAVKGEARLSGIPASIDFQARGGNPGEAVVQLTLDDAARSRRSLPTAPLLSGPVPVRITASLGPKAQTRVEADLSRASIDNLVPGWTKAAGRPGKVSFLLGPGETPDLRDLALDAGQTQIKGQLSLSASGGLERADLPVFRISPGDDLRAQLDRSGGVYRIGLKGNVGDARPIMKWLTAPGDKKGAGKELPDFDLDLAINILAGHNDESMTGATAKASARNGSVRALQFGGRFRSASVDMRLARPDSGSPLLSVQSSDAGATLRFVDLYRRAFGGKLSLDARIGDSSQDGLLSVEGFRLRGEPALRQLVTESAPAPTGPDERGGTAERINPDEVQFAKLTADFRRTASRIDYRDVVMWGPQVGFNLSGMVDYGRDVMDVTGTFVPAYTLNNAFSQVPLVGLLLGGGANEGLFAIDFRVSGPVSAPRFNINPLSVMAPGILRKFIGAVMPPGGELPPAATGAVAPRGR